MDTEDVLSLVEDLGGNIDDLEQALAPILKTALSTSTSKLPLLDKAKLYVLATYAIESILFSALRLNGTDAKIHPVFQEINRVKEYFAKIKSAETAGTKRSTTVDREAAGRFIKHGLAGNDRYDRERSERMARESAGAKRKFEDMHERVGTHTRFEDTAKRVRQEDEGGDPEPVRSEQALDKKAAKRQRRLEARLAQQAAGGSSAAPSEPGSEDRSADTGESDGVRWSAKAPKSHNETFQALLEGPLPQTDDKGSGKKKKRKGRGQLMKDLENKRAEEMM